MQPTFSPLPKLVPTLPTQFAQTTLSAHKAGKLPSNGKDLFFGAQSAPRPKYEELSTLNQMWFHLTKGIDNAILEPDPFRELQELSARAYQRDPGALTNRLSRELPKAIDMYTQMQENLILEASRVKDGERTVFVQASPEDRNTLQQTMGRHLDIILQALKRFPIPQGNEQDADAARLKVLKLQMRLLRGIGGNRYYYRSRPDTSTTSHIAEISRNRDTNDLHSVPGMLYSHESDMLRAMREVEEAISLNIRRLSKSSPGDFKSLADDIVASQYRFARERYDSTPSPLSDAIVWASKQTCPQFPLYHDDGSRIRDFIGHLLTLGTDEARDAWLKECQENEEARATAEAAKAAAAAKTEGNWFTRAFKKK